MSDEGRAKHCNNPLPHPLPHQRHLTRGPFEFQFSWQKNDEINIRKGIIGRLKGKNSWQERSRIIPMPSVCVVLWNCFGNLILFEFYQPCDVARQLFLCPFNRWGSTGFKGLGSLSTATALVLSQQECNWPMSSDSGSSFSLVKICSLQHYRGWWKKWWNTGRKRFLKTT